jgi:hypothetical protein
VLIIAEAAYYTAVRLNVGDPLDDCSSPKLKSTHCGAPAEPLKRTTNWDEARKPHPLIAI